MKAVFFGLGSIGRRHAKLLLDNFDYELFAYRSNKHSPANGLGLKELHSWEELKELNADVAFITNPTSLHLQTALRCADLGMHLFIEKPLSNTLQDVDLLESICRKKRLTCYVAYCLRFHPVIKKISELITQKNIYHVRVSCSSYLPHWRLDQDFKKSYSVSAQLGGGVLFDLSHEFDYLQHLFGEITQIRGTCGRASNITVDSEDFADASLKTAKGVHINLHLDFLSLWIERRILVDFEDGYLIGDLIANRVEYLYRKDKQVFSFDPSRNSYFQEQLSYFFGNIGNPLIINTLGESKNILTRILELKSG